MHRDRLQAEVDDAFVNAPLGSRVRSMGPAGWALVVALVAGLLMVVGTISNRRSAVPTMSVPAPAKPAMETFDPPRRYRVVTVGKVRVANVRSVAGADAPIVDRLRRGSTISAIGRTVGPDGAAWIAYRRSDGSTAFVAEKLLKEAVEAMSTVQCAGGAWPAAILCRDATLKRLNADVASTYRRTMASMIAVDRDRLAIAQEEWLVRRDACRKETDPGVCLTAAYRTRLAEVRDAAAGRLEPAPPEGGGAAPAAASATPASGPTFGSQPQLRGDPAMLITSDDYPPAALREGRSGRVSVRLHVSGTGLVDGCDVTASSGSSDLDETTCRLLRRRSHYSPARDAGGTITDASVTRSIMWSLPE